MLINSTISNIGPAIQHNKLPTTVMDQISDLLDEDYPVEGSTYRLGDLVMLFPMDELPRPLATCNWGLVTEDDTGIPLSVFPDISSNTAYELRRFLCCTAKAPIAFYHRLSDTAYLSRMNHDWTLGAWFTLATDDFIHADSF